MSHLMNLPKVWFCGLAISLGLAEASAVQLGSRSADEWVERLDRTERVAGMKIEEVVARLKLKPGDRVADIGAGTGVFSGPLARAVAPNGTLFAVEIDQALLDHIGERAKQEDVKNIRTVLGKFEDPNLPSREVDLAFFHLVLHHIEHRGAYLKTLASYLKPDGRMVVIDQIDGHKDQPEMQMTLEEVKQGMATAGFHLVEEFDLFEDKFFAVFAQNP